MKWWPYYEKWFRNERYQAKTAPLLTPPLYSSPVSLPAVRIMIDLLQMARRKHPLIFQCFIKNTYLQLYHWGTDANYTASFQMAHGRKGMILPTHDKINYLQYYFRSESISSVTKWILIRYNEAWVWLEVFQGLCWTPHCQHVLIQLIISQLGQDEPHTVNNVDDESTYIFQNPAYWCSAVFFLNSFFTCHTISWPDLWINSMFVLEVF